MFLAFHPDQTLPLHLCIYVLKKYSYTCSVLCLFPVRLWHGEGLYLCTESLSLISMTVGNAIVWLSLLRSLWTLTPRLFNVQVFIELPLHTRAKILTVHFK